MDEVLKDENLDKVKQDEAVKNEVLKNETKLEDEKKYSDKDVDEIINKKFAKWQREQEEKIKEEKRLSKLSADERAKEESKKKDEVIEKLKAEIDRNNLERDTIDRLNEEGLPLTFKSFLMRENAENTNEVIKSFKEVYQKAIQEEVEKRFKGHTPKTSTGNNTATAWQRVANRYK